MKVTHLITTLTAVLALGLAGPGTALAQETGPPVIVFDHFKTNDNRTFDVDVEAGSFFRVKIVKTCPKNFEYSYIGIEPGERVQARGGDKCTATGSKTLVIPHEARFRGYLVEIAPTNGLEWLAPSGDSNCDANPSPCKKVKKLLLTISVNSPGWTYEMSGGGVVSQLTNPVFALETRPVEGEGGGEEMFVVRNHEAEDDAALGFAGFVHVFHAKHPRVAGTFGLGLNEGNEELSFFIGPSWRLGGKGYLTAGWNWGPVQRLPNGLSFDRPVTDTNLLSNLPTRTDGKFFFGFSFSFLSPGKDFFKKPFASPPEPDGGGGGNVTKKDDDGKDDDGKDKSASTGTVADPSNRAGRRPTARARGARRGGGRDLAALASRAPLCFRGRLLSRETDRTEDGELIVSKNRFEVLEVITGEIDEDEITLTTLGGTSGDVTLRVSHMPVFKEGWEYVVFADPEASTYPQVIGGTDGVFVVGQPSGAIYSYGLRSVMGESGGHLVLGEQLETAAGIRSRELQQDPQVEGGRVLDEEASEEVMLLEATDSSPEAPAAGWTLDDLRTAIRRADG
jgi:hypothetical protein